MVAVATPILRHRLILNFTAQSEGVTVDDVITQLVKAAAKARRGLDPGERWAQGRLMAQSGRRARRRLPCSALKPSPLRMRIRDADADLPQPDVLARAEALGLKARPIVEGLRVGDHKSPYSGFSVEFVQHREYVPGDDIRHIDWKSYGRSERYTIKQYEQETNFIGHILLDASQVDAVRRRATTNKLEYAKLLAATLAYLIVHQRDSVGLRRLRRPAGAAELPASSQLGHINTILHTLEDIAAAGQDDASARCSTSWPTGSAAAGWCSSSPTASTTWRPIARRAAAPAVPGARGACCSTSCTRTRSSSRSTGTSGSSGWRGSRSCMTRPHLIRPAYLRIVKKYLTDIQKRVRRERGGLRADADEPAARSRRSASTSSGACRRGGDESKLPRPSGGRQPPAAVEREQAGSRPPLAQAPAGCASASRSSCSGRGRPPACWYGVLRGPTRRPRRFQGEWQVSRRRRRDDAQAVDPGRAATAGPTCRRAAEGGRTS